MFKKIYFDSLPSTNTYLKENYQKYHEFTVVICNNQTSGHGRLNRKWEMEAGKNIALSILLKPKQGVAKLSLLTCAAVFLALKKYTNNLQIKWPNDILLNGKKVSGILLESIYNNSFVALIVGIGVNVNNNTFSENISKKATSLKIEMQHDFNLNIIIDDILNNFNTLYQQYQNNIHHYLDICRNNSSIIGKNVYLNGRYVKVLTILDNGNLLINNGETTEEIAFGEISLENNY